MRSKKAEADKEKLLDELWLRVNENYGLQRLHDAVAQLCEMLDYRSDEAIRLGLCVKCAFNAVVIADDKYANESLFLGYDKIDRLTSERIATYIGSEDWKQLAEDVRSAVVDQLRASGDV
jgi:hypothetical protein